MAYLNLIAVALVMLPPASAQAPQSRAEMAQLYAAGGFPIGKSGPVDPCGAPARPGITFVDLNGDQRPEAIFRDSGTCYLPEKAHVSIVTRQADGKWRQLFGQDGSVNAVTTRSSGWLDLQWTTGSGTRSLRYDGTGYVASVSRPSASAVIPGHIASAIPAPTTTRPGDPAVFRAAGFTKKGTQWRSQCDDPDTRSYAPGAIEHLKDLNGDGYPEAIVTEQSVYCYGNTGTGFWLVSKQSAGVWKLMTNGTGTPEFLSAKGTGGWPDISLGGPGFCFTVQRWNGRLYANNRREYQGKICK